MNYDKNNNNKGIYGKDVLQLYPTTEVKKTWKERKESKYNKF